MIEVCPRTGRLDEARLLSERMMTFSNHLGLYAEQTGPCGETLGNSPRAFTHMVLISPEWKLDRKLGRNA